MDTPTGDGVALHRARGRAATLVLACSTLLAIAMMALAVPAAADAHVQKNKRGVYVLAVDGWRRMAQGFVADVNNHADTLTDIASGMSEVIPPEDANEQAVLDGYKRAAGDWQAVEADYAVKVLPEVQKNMNTWEKKVKPWFRKASDKRALEKAVDAYMKGFAHLVHESHGELEDAAAALKAEDLQTANEHIALAIGGIAFAEQEMMDAVAALKALR